MPCVYKFGGRTLTEEEFKDAVARDLPLDEAARLFPEIQTVPDMPMSKNWQEMALRRMIRYAAENGYDGISWTGGAEQAERYDLSKRISKVTYAPVDGSLRAYDLGGNQVISEIAGPNELPDYIGKEAAEKLLQAPAVNPDTMKAGDKTTVDHYGEEAVVTLNPERRLNEGKPNESIMVTSTDGRENSWYVELRNLARHKLSGVDLKVGGEGMHGFYDKIVPDYLNKFGKKFGARVAETVANQAGTLTLEEQRVIDESKRLALEARDAHIHWQSAKDRTLDESERLIGTEGQEETSKLLREEVKAYDAWKAAQKDYDAYSVLNRNTIERSNELKDAKDLEKTVPYLPITPAMRESVLKEGVSLFDLGKWFGRKPATPAPAQGPADLKRQRADILLRETLKGAEEHAEAKGRNAAAMNQAQAEMTVLDQEWVDLLSAKLGGSMSAPALRTLDRRMDELAARRKALLAQMEQMHRETKEIERRDPHVGEVRVDGQGNPTVWLNRTAMGMVKRAIYPDDNDPDILLKGSDWSVAETRWVRNRLATQAPVDGDEERVGRPLMRLLDAALANARKGGVTLVGKTGLGVQSAIGTMREELLHRWQRSRMEDGLPQTHLPEKEFAELFLHMPQGVIDHLREMGYRERGAAGKEMFVIEAAAKIMAGKGRRMGLSEAEGRAWLERYYDKVSQQHGKAAIAEIRHTRGFAREMQKEWEQRNEADDRGPGGGSDRRPGADDGRVVSSSPAGRQGGGKPVDDAGGRKEDDSEPGRPDRGLSGERGQRDAGGADATHGRADGGERSRAGVERAPLEVAGADRLKTDTPEFKAWFGKSKVVDGDGKPLTLYHGTTRKNPKVLNESFESGLGIFLTDNDDVAGTFTLPREYGETVFEDEDGEEIEPGDVVPLYARIENPLVIEGHEAQKVSDDTAVQARTLKQAKAAGHDGVILRDVDEGIGETYPGDTYIVFDPKQVKHAERNAGTYDPESANILKDVEKQPERRSASPVADDLGKKIEGALTEMRSTVDALTEDEDSPFGNCTAAAKEVISKVGHGEIWGYEHAKNPTAALGETEYGHDFAIIGPYLADHWANDYYMDPWLYDLRNPADVEKVKKQYGDPALWGRYDKEHGKFIYDAKPPEILRRVQDEEGGGGSHPDKPNEWEAHEAKYPGSYAREKNEPWVELVNVNDLLPLREYEWSEESAREGSEYFRKLKADIAKHGFRTPITIRYFPKEKRALIIEGNHRVAAARELGLKSVPARVTRASYPMADYGSDAKGGPVKLAPQEKNRSDYMKPSEIGLRTENGTATVGDVDFSPIVSDIRKEFPHATGIELAGSFARGELKPKSDIDIVIQLPPGTDQFAASSALDPLFKKYREGFHGRQVDFISHVQGSQSFVGQHAQRIESGLETPKKLLWGEAYDEKGEAAAYLKRVREAEAQLAKKSPEEAAKATNWADPPRAGDTVDGLTVTSHVPNTSSIEESFTVLPGIREIPLDEGWSAAPEKTFAAADDIRRSYALAEKIKQSGEIAPLIMAVENGEPHILEGVHRLAALHLLGKKSFPALVAVDEIAEPTPAQARTIRAYHGTRAGEFEQFKPNYRRGEQLGFGIHFAEDADFAEHYALDEETARKGKKPMVYTVDLAINKLLKADGIVKKGSPEFSLAEKLAGKKLFTQKDENGVRVAFMQAAIDATSPRRAEQVIRDAGYDGIEYAARIIKHAAPGRYTKHGEGKSYVVFDPAQVKIASKKTPEPPQLADLEKLKDEAAARRPVRPYNREAYKTPEREYSAKHWTPEETDEEARERRRLRQEWEQSALAALSRGELTPEEAEERGIHTSPGPDKFKPLPPKLFHVTTAADAVEADGIKPRWEMQMQGAVGLGGGSDYAISFTTDLKLARDIEKGIHTARKVAAGEITVQDMVDMVQRGEGAPRPFMDEFEKALQAVIGGDKPLEAALQEEVVEQSMFGKPPERGAGWEIDPDGYHWTGGDGVERYLRWKRPMTEEEKAESRWRIFKAFSPAREWAGGQTDPLFIFNDPNALGRIDPRQIALLFYEPEKGAMGTYESGMTEWRVYSGHAVKLVDRIDREDGEKPQ